MQIITHILMTPMLLLTALQAVKASSSSGIDSCCSWGCNTLS
jgi:hypothetical protein